MTVAQKERRAQILEIATLIIAILSLIATAGVAFVIFFLQIRLERNSRVKAEQQHEALRKRDIANHARLFLLDHAEQLEYLTLAQVATARQREVKIYSDGSGRYTHVRKFYGIYHRCESELQAEILRQAKFCNYSLDKFSFDKLTQKLLDLFERDARALGLLGGTSFLYDGGKYFHRIIERYGATEIGAFADGKMERSIWSHLLDFVDFGKADDKKALFDKLKNNSLSRLLDDRKGYKTPDTFAEFEKAHQSPPLNQYWYLVSNSDEESCTYVVTEIIRQGATMICREKYKGWAIELDYAEPETYEDLYYATVLTLYCLYYNEVKDLHELKAGGNDE